ncbi:MAG: hypothetical protein N2112_00640 [Gemmataceae bacterium]|jgi:hypothetical protein|nr:hypothetical protein [Gemmataceae bacterium]
MNEEILFEQVLELPEEERASFLDHECPDPVLRQQLEALLVADTANQSILTIVESLPESYLFRTIGPPPDDPMGPEGLLKKIIEETLGQLRDRSIRIINPLSQSIIEEESLENINLKPNVPQNTDK